MDALLHGPLLHLPPGLPHTLAGCVAARVRRRPRNMLHSVGQGTDQGASFEKAWARAGVIAAVLRRDVGDQRHIVLLQEEHIDQVVTFWACLRAGITAVPLYSTAAAALRDPAGDWFRRLLRSLRSPVFVADVEAAMTDVVRASLPGADIRLLGELERAGADLTAPIGPERDAEPVVFVATSGSTGRVKLVGLDASALKHRYFSANYGSLSSEDAVLGLFPFDSITGLRGAFLGFASWTQVSRQVVATQPLEILKVVERFAITLTHTTNSLALRLAEASEGFAGDLSRLRTFGFAGEAVTRTVALRVAEMLARHGSAATLIAGYGSSETGPVLVGADPTVPDANGEDRVSLGACAAGVSVRIVSDEGHLLPQGALGHVEISSPQALFSEFADGSRSSAMTPDGWWKSGDLGDVNDGTFAVRGRSKDVINVGGLKRSLVDIDLFLQNPENGWRAWSYVFRDADDATDQLGVAFCPSAADDRHRELLAERIRAAIGRRFGIVARRIAALAADELPLTATCKIDRRRLASICKTGLEDPASAVGGDNSFDRVAVAWRKAFGFDVAPDVDFFQAGGDSFCAMQLDLAWRELFGTPLPPHAFSAGATIRSMSTMLDGTLVQPSARPHLEAIERRQRQLLANWRGRRPTRGGLIVGPPVPASRSREGKTWRPFARRFAKVPPRDEPRPTFWVLQHGNELTLLHDHLPPSWNPHGLRSGRLLVARHDDLFRDLVALYLAEIRGLQPNGPYRIGGTCQGGAMAMAIATGLEELGDRVELLTMIDCDLGSLLVDSRFKGPIAFTAGRKSRFNPRRRFSDPLQGWRKYAPGGVAMRLIDADYAGVFSPDTIAELVEAIDAGWDWARRRAPASEDAPARAPEYKARIVVPRTLAVRRGDRLAVRCEMQNLGGVVCTGGAQSGLGVANHWLDADGGLRTWLDAFAPLPTDVRAGDTVAVDLAVAAPATKGTYLLEIDMVEQGICWFKEQGVQSGYVEVHVI